jgi:hypothetical protein
MGIDYGMGMTNIDKSNGIRYGVISQNEVLQAWADSSEPWYGEESEWPKDEDGEPYLDDMAEPLSFTYEEEGYMAECGEDGDIFITKSPFYTFCSFCSPCAPGAGYLMSKDDGVRAYCFGHDWFEGDKAPYEVYRVSDDRLVRA